MLKFISKKIALVFSLLLYSEIGYSNEKGYLFQIGEKILGLQGLSFLGLEKKVKELEANQKLVKSPPDSCTESHLFNQMSYRETTGFDILDILSAGCEGNLSKKTKTTVNGSSQSQTVNFDEKIKIYLSKNTLNLNFVKIKRDIRTTKTSIDDLIEVPPFSHGRHRPKQTPEDFPTIILGETYEYIKETLPSQYYQKSSYNISYTVEENSKDQLVIKVKGIASATSVRENSTAEFDYHFTCIGKTLAEIETMAEENANEQEVKKIKEEIFGN